jgi:hypothetical protein
VTVRPGSGAGEFNLTLRMQWPGGKVPAVVNGGWKPPAAVLARWRPGCLQARCDRRFSEVAPPGGR